MEKLTQINLALLFCKQKGYICPALHSRSEVRDKWGTKIGWLGSEIDRRCRELREEGLMYSHPRKRLEYFFTNKMNFERFKRDPKKFLSDFYFKP